MTALSSEQGLFTQTLTNMIIVLKAAMRNAFDENRIPYPKGVEVRAQYATGDFALPRLFVAYEPGEITFQPGLNVLDYDSSNEVFARGFFCDDAQFVVTIEATSAAERFYLMDRLISMLVKGWGRGRDTGEVIEAILLNTLGALGINVTGFSSPQFSMADLKEQRSENQLWRAVLTLKANVWYTWETDPVVLQSPALVKQTVALGPGDQGLEKLFSVFTPV